MSYSDQESLSGDSVSVNSASVNSDEVTLWDNILQHTCNSNKSLWQKLFSENDPSFEIRFSEAYIESCKYWLKKIDEFIEDDDVWGAIGESRSRLNETIDDMDESLMAAIDIRKYKIYTTINWQHVETVLQDDVVDEEDEEQDDDVFT